MENNLDPVTSSYILSKYMLMDTENPDLRHMTENVKQEMQMMEKEAAYDYLKVEKEMYDLDEEIENSD